MNLLRTKNTLLLAAAVFLLLLAIVANDPAGWFSRSYARSALLIDQIRPAEVNQIQIYQGSELKLALFESNGQWQLQKPGENTLLKADGRKIQQALKNLLEIRRFQKAGSSPERQKEYRLSAEDFHVQLAAGSQKIDVFLAEIESDPGSNLVRLATENDIYAVRRPVKSFFEPIADQFRELALLHFTLDNLASVEISGAFQYSLKKDQAGIWQLWYKNRQQEANPQLLASLLTQLTNLNGQAFADHTAEKKPLYATARFVLASNEEELLEIRSAGNEYLVRSRYNPFWLSLPRYLIDNVIKSPEALVK